MLRALTTFQKINMENNRRRAGLTGGPMKAWDNNNNNNIDRPSQPPLTNNEAEENNYQENNYQENNYQEETTSEDPYNRLKTFQKTLSSQKNQSNLSKNAAKIIPEGIVNRRINEYNLNESERSTSKA